MKAVVYRPIHRNGSWRPRSLVDMRGPRFPEEYEEILVLEAGSVEKACDQYPTRTGDVVFMGEGDDLDAYVISPYGWEIVRFGREWRSHE